MVNSEIDELRSRLSAAVAEQKDTLHVLDMSIETTNLLLRERDTLQARVLVLESAVRWALGYDEGEPQFGADTSERGAFAWRRELRRRAALTPPADPKDKLISTIVYYPKEDRIEYVRPKDRTPPADPQGDPYRDALAELVNAKDDDKTVQIHPVYRARFTIGGEPTRIEKAWQRARALLSGTDAQQEGKS